MLKYTHAKSPEDYLTQRYSLNGDCWEWTSCLTPKGYGAINKKTYGERTAHRLSYKVFVGDVGNNYVCHKCDNPKCINPEHLFLGTPEDNSQDMVKKGRSLKAELNPRAKLSEGDIVSIRKLKGVVPGREVANLYGVSKSNVYAIWAGQTWCSHA